METAGWMCALGVPGWRLIESRDQAERLALIALTKHAADARARLDDALAARLGGGPVG